MLKKLLKDNELKNITVSRHIEPRYITKKKFFGIKTEEVQDGAWAIYIVKKDYIHSLLRVVIECDKDITPDIIQAYDGVVSPEYWTKLNLSDQEKIEVWKEIKKLYEDEQKKKQEPEYWKEKIENARIQGQQQQTAFVNEILNMLRGVQFSNKDFYASTIRERGHEGDVGAPALLGYCIEAYGFLFSYYREKSTLTVNQTIDGGKKLILVVNYINNNQADDFIAICLDLWNLQRQRMSAKYEKEEQEKTINERKAKYDKLQLENQRQKEKYDSFLKNFSH